MIAQAQCVVEAAGGFPVVRSNSAWGALVRNPSHQVSVTGVALAVDLRVVDYQRDALQRLLTEAALLSRVGTAVFVTGSAVDADSGPVASPTATTFEPSLVHLKVLLLRLAGCAAVALTMRRSPRWDTTPKSTAAAPRRTCWWRPPVWR